VTGLGRAMTGLDRMAGLERAAGLDRMAGLERAAGLGRMAGLSRGWRFVAAG
jgi:hypothetical protein